LEESYRARERAKARAARQVDTAGRLEGAPAKAIQELMGHADLTTAQRYMRLTPQATQEAIRRRDVQARGDVGETKKPPAQEAS